MQNFANGREEKCVPLETDYFTEEGKLNIQQHNIYAVSLLSW